MWNKLLVIVCVRLLSAKELTYYIDFEHPNVTYCNPKYMEDIKVTAQRYQRLDPIHYVNMHFKLLADFGNEFRVNTYIYEFLSNEYRPSIIEFHYKICDAFDNPKFNVFKPIYQQYVNASSCPFPKGEYNFMNISVPNMPLLKTFPLRKGRMFTTVLHREDRVVEGYIDIVIKQRFL